MPRIDAAYFLRSGVYETEEINKARELIGLPKLKIKGLKCLGHKCITTVVSVNGANRMCDLCQPKYNANLFEV